jgi:hypothetical protein
MVARARKLLNESLAGQHTLGIDLGRERSIELGA